MDNEQLRERTKAFSLEVLKMLNFFPGNTKGWVIGKQVLKSATSVAANYRATCRARSRAEFFSKMSIVVEEADETLFWLELVRDSEMLEKKFDVTSTIKEAQELLYIFASARKSMRERL